MASESICILFGAGASKGSGDIGPVAPPLGGELFAELVSRFDSWAGLPGPILDVFEDAGFEAGMSLVWDQQPAMLDAMVDMAMYFSEFHMTPKRGCYSKLISELDKFGLLGITTFATLNYECTLELALNEAGRPVSYFEPAGAGPGISVLKPHGSCNWLIPQNITIVNPTFVGVSTFYEGPLRAVPPVDLPRLRMQNEIGIPPAMSLFMPGKPSPVSPSVMASIRQHWANAVHAAGLVICIGASPMFADPHVWDPLTKTAAEIWYIGGTESADFERLSASCAGRFLHVGQRFSEELSTLVGQLRFRRR